MAHRCRRVGAVHHIIRVAPTGSKASPNVRYAFNGDQIVRRNEPTRCAKAAVSSRSKQRCYSITSSARASSDRRHVEAERLGGLEVDHQLVLGRRLHRQVGRLLALEDAVDVAGRAPVLVDEIRPIGDQAAGGDEEAIGVDRGQFVPGRKRDDQIAMNDRRRARRHDQAAIRGARECRDGALDLAGVAHVDRAHLHPERRRHGLDCGELADPGGYGGIPKDRRSRHARRDLLEQLQPFPAHAVFERA